MQLIDKFIASIIEREGGYVNNPNDSGGETKYGITKEVARRYGYTSSMLELPKVLAEDIYRNEYWKQPGFDKVSLIDESIAERLLDFSVLAGPQTSGKTLQRALNVLNRNGFDYPDMKVDGKIGLISIQALKIFVGKRGKEGATVLKGMITAQCSVHLIECAERNSKNEEFEYGWQLNRAIGTFL